MGLTIGTVNTSGVEIKVVDTSVVFSGSIDCANPNEFLTPFLTELHDKIMKSGIKEIKFDIRKLSFLNSSGIKAIADWILKVDALDMSQKYTIVIMTSTEYKWQESSMSTLVYLGPGFIKKVSE
ncbi:MAG: hypothetical protein A2015_14750 [Spirochaetes bacterium GWF1_31_7]|nr:MAG: hypothetical protein A2Y30_10435 [Spirochaetes bacterium GWE1_32_154]OHD47094.1 MAG: hypothetical protein A2Y29_02210 [Spirochaetes bacterium GWE2_31_10]OHD51737.1 MAG: hypothetical protein A2015_14750 [Spirochaetes bacterium GWF1_31_7]OHD76840.1 MAG: hypothetical protein A2355_05485 [Spirochaetes bacterium RIFOXYB1_FULL_32_8]HBD92672.1 hypothetical protein [Spirochaetia bacterium]